MKLKYDIRSKVRTFFGGLYEMKVKGRLDFKLPETTLNITIYFLIYAAKLKSIEDLF